MNRIIHTICSFLEQGEDLVLATILSHEGSTPRTAGTKMIVKRDGETISTVGGGLVEAEVIKAASEIFQTRTSQIKPFDLTGANIEAMDLVCGGRLEILVEFVASDSANLQVFQGLAFAMKERTRCFLVADLGSISEQFPTVKRCLIREGGNISGDMICPSGLIDAVSRWTGMQRYPVLLTVEGRNYLVEPSFVPGTVCLFGAGHVSQQVAPLAKLVGFRVVVLDDRAEFANRDRFPLADEIYVTQSFNNCLTALEIDQDSYLAIVTRGHLHDKTVLEQSLKTDAHYIGMIGSRNKRDRIFGELKAQGFTAEDFARVHAPIGTDIGAETPEEIGISIVGELILARSQRNQ
jgi:xanthine dehydrogenase accessory factor